MYKTIFVQFLSNKEIFGQLLLKKNSNPIKNNFFGFFLKHFSEFLLIKTFFY